ncbi:MAG TPA: acyl-CoA dehydrogenase family protein, partial [Mycobacterium sp.]
MTTVGSDFVARLADRAAEAEKLRRLPSATVDDYRESGLARLLLPARYGGRQAEFPEIFDVVRRMAHGCASSAWTLGFYTLHNWMLALFCEQAQDEVFVDGPVLCPGHTAGMCATGSNDVVVDDVWVPGHRLVTVADIYSGTTPGAALHDAAVYRWPMVPALALTAAMAALGSAELVADLFAQRLSERVLAYSGAAQKDQPTAQVRRGGARVRLRALHGLADAAAADIQARVSSGKHVGRTVR